MSARDAETPALRCTGEPLSWLALERLRLGELPQASAAPWSSTSPRARPARRAWPRSIGRCRCPRCLRHPRQRRSGRACARGGARGAWRIWAPAGIAALLALFLIARPKALDDAHMDRTLAGLKGGGVALSLVRERDGAVDHGATTFAGRDHWKALVTCPAARVMFWDVVVLDGATATFPLAPSAPLACGNRVPMPGAFRLDGDQPLEVCLLLAADPIDRARVTAHDERATCVLLRPER